MKNTETQLINCPECHKVISTRLSIHDCSVVIRFHVVPASTLRGWYVKRVVKVEGKETGDRWKEKFTTKREAKAAKDNQRRGALTMYDIHIYRTQADYEARCPQHVLSGLETKQGALDEGQLWLSDHEVVKVQSGDREFIEILTTDRKGALER